MAEADSDILNSRLIQGPYLPVRVKQNRDIWQFTSSPEACQPYTPSPLQAA